jgi:putative ABC transport system permease protein
MRLQIPGLDILLRLLSATLILAIREIRRHLLRSCLTSLGIIIGVAAVATLVTLGKGVSASVQEDISALGSNTLIVIPMRGDRAQARPFDQRDVEAVSTQISGVLDAAGTVSTTTNAFFGGINWSTKVEGGNRSFMRAQSITVELGRAFSEAEETTGNSVCLLGQTVVGKLFEDASAAIGESLRLGGIPCTVVGIMSPRNASGGSSDVDNSVLMPLKSVQRRFIGSSDIQTFYVRYDDAFAGSSMQESIAALLRERRLLRDIDRDDFDIIDTAQINDAASAITGTLTAMVAVIAGISLVVGGIGIMNIMLVSVTERTREIGIRLAIGALPHEVRLQFLIEAMVLCAFGGFMGLSLAFVLSLLLANLIDIPFVFDPIIYIVAFVFSASLGVVFGYYPASRASKLDPIEALRAES